MTDQTPGCGATSDARKRRTEAHQIHPDAGVRSIVAREVAAAVRAVEAERDEWQARRDAAVAQCRHLHQDGKTREQWHIDNCGAMSALADLRERVEALAVLYGSHANVSQFGKTYRNIASDLRALLQPAREPKP